VLKKLLFVVAFLTMAVPAFAQTNPRHTFINEPLRSAEDYARRIETCQTREEFKKTMTSSQLNLSCESLIDSFNEIPDLKDVSSVPELAAYVRSLHVMPCPAKEQVEIAGVVDDKVHFFKRPFRDGEMCLVDLGENRFVSSMVCGQWCKTPFAYRFTGLATPVSDEQDTSHRNKALQDSTKDVTTKLAKDANPHGFFSLHRTSGKVFWYGVVPTAAIAAVACLVPQDDGAGHKVRGCFVNTNILNADFSGIR
jgi:hypothetical protein